MADTLLATDASPQLFDARTGLVLPSVTVGVLDLVPGNQRVRLVISASRVMPYQELSIVGKNFTTVTVGGSMTVPR
jgi:hypothetical protein